MRRVLLLIALFAVAGCQKTESTQRPVKVTVSYSGFLPECVRVIARDTGGKGELSADPAGKGTRDEGGQLIIAVMTPEDWGDSLDVEAQAYEKFCTGKMVVSQKTTVTLKRGAPVDAALQLTAVDQDKDGYVALPHGTDCNDDQSAIFPEAQELCNDVDDNCNRVTDEGFRLGETCSAGQGCEGTWQCGVNGTTVCGNITNATLAYPDADRDGRGDKNAAAVSLCNPAGAGHVPGPNDDCDDNNPNVRPGAQERCNTVDDDCDGAVDEGFGVGTTCNLAQQCTGRVTCDLANGMTVCEATATASTWYPDADGDGSGVSAGAVMSCVRPAGFAARDGDCNEGNPFIHPTAQELCDAQDNDCDTVVDETPACPGTGASWAERTVPASGSQAWQSVSTWVDGGVWAVGANNHRAVLVPGGNTFNVTTAPGGCGSASSGWYSVWADPTNGRAWLGSAGGRLAWQDPAASECTQVTVTELAVYGIVGLRTNGVLSLYGASDSSASNEGAAFVWDGAGSVVFNQPPNQIGPVYDIHGSSRATLFAVGGYEANFPTSATPRIYRFNSANGQWQSQGVQDTVSGVGVLRGVWVVNDTLAFAVGDSGSVLRWNGMAWSKLNFPNTEDLTSVVAFGTASAYAVSNNGRIYRYNGQSWTQIHEVSGAQFKDIAGTSPGDLWVVGTGGRILHWPQWPQ